MPVLRKNVRLQTKRASYDPLTTQTSGAAPYQSGIAAHIHGTSSQELAVLPDAAFGSEYTAIVETGTAIAIGDVISSITLLDGITPWPGDVIRQGNADAPTIIWRVAYIQENSIALLPYRAVYIKRDQLSGPMGN